MKDFGNFGRHFPFATSTKFLAACTRVCLGRVMAQYVLKIEKLSSHIILRRPILEMASAYGLRPRLWLLSESNNSVDQEMVSQQEQEAEEMILETSTSQYRLKRTRVLRDNYVPWHNIHVEM